MTKIINGQVILEDTIQSGINVYFDQGLITAVTAEDLPCATVINAQGHYLSPGFIDIHSHGGGNSDFLDGTTEAFLTAAALHAQYGTTTIIPTATSGDWASTLAMLAAYEAAQARNQGGADMPGLHFEGPYFAMSQRGAQDPRYLRNPRPEEYRPVLDACPRLMRWSCAPELPGALDMGRELTRRGVLAAIGHSNADYDMCAAAFSAGYTHVTHLYSGMSTVHRKNLFRHGGVVEAAYLMDDMTVEIIADGKHLPAELLRLIYKIKGPERIALITDSMRGAGMPDGPTMLGHREQGQPCIIDDGVAKLPDLSAFAGSVATFDRLVRNMVNLAQVPLTKAVQMATRTPAAIMKLHDRGQLKKGLRADIAIFDKDIRMQQVIVGGRTVYRRGNESASAPLFGASTTVF